MQTRPEKYTVQDLVNSWNDASLKVNGEYQRGAKWTTSQQQALIDSLFRNYPVPPIFLHEIKARGLGGQESIRYEIVDGQQRVRALALCLGDKFPLLAPDDRKLKLPNSLRSLPSPWAGKRFSELSNDLKDTICKTKVDVFVVEKVELPDEIRDLFIRLQAGTALSRQQIRDAWPGSVGPFIERLGGKLTTSPSIKLFQLADKRGNKTDDDRDKFESDRQFCAQILTIFLARERDPNIAQPVGANDLDGLYHENTELDVNGPSAKRFIQLLSKCTDILERAIALQTNQGVSTRKKFKKLDILALFQFLQDVSRDQSFMFTQGSTQKLANCLLKDRVHERKGRSTSGNAIREHFIEWRKGVPEAIGVQLDERRLFDEDQKQVIFTKSNGVCGVCAKPVESGDDEYDHYPVPYHVGGRTNAENGRLVHRACHPRGRPTGTDD